MLNKTANSKTNLAKCMEIVGIDDHENFERAGSSSQGIHPSLARKSSSDS